MDTLLIILALLAGIAGLMQHLKGGASLEERAGTATQEAIKQTYKEVLPPDAPHLKNQKPSARYSIRKSILTPGEVDFHKCLLKAVPEAPIFPKVRVADVVEAKKRYSGDFLRISQKHFDWVLCHPISHEPLIAIELDDSSHTWSDKQRKNDSVKNAVAKEAGLHLMRFPWQRSYDVEAIRTRIGDVLDQIADKKEAEANNNFD